jgi:CRP/FNR family transcriptional regulator, cyclic AMP receptor protein
MGGLMPGLRMRRRRERLLELDPELGDRLSPDELRDAQAQLLTPVARLEPGVWNPFPALRSDGTASILVLEGLLVREVVIAETRWAELIGPGDLLELTDVDLGGPFIQVELVCTVTEASRIALLDARFTAMLARWPGVNLSLVERLEQRFLRLSTQATICQLPCVEARLLALLWHLAERWGRIGPNGVILPLSLLHRTLALLVGAQRPTVTLALKTLARAGLVLRRDDGVWLLRGTLDEGLARVSPRERASAASFCVT